MARKRRRTKRKGGLLQINSARGRKVRSNARVSMPVRELRRLVSAAGRGEKATVKAVLR